MRSETTTRRWFRQTLAQMRKDALYLLASMPVLILGFCVVVSFVLTGAAAVIIWIGIPILAMGVLIARGFATLHRRVAPLVGDGAAPEVHYDHFSADAPWFKRLIQLLRDPQSWLDVLWVHVAFVVSVITWSLAVIWIVGALATVLGPISALILGGLFREGYSGMGEVLGVSSPLIFNVFFNLATGLVFLVTAPFVLRGLASVQLGLGDLLLSNPGRDRARVSELTAARQSARTAEMDALRRLERDIHDGPQQRLVRLQMDLARAKRHAVSDPDRTDEILDNAMSQTHETLAELRNLSRGIAPPILVDRGLEAAVTEIAATSAVPVTVYASLPAQLPAHVESAAYFVVAEGLANINKHSGATDASVTLAVADESLYLSVNDDGRGGASIAKGHGLAGLNTRLHGMDASLEVSSPEGGPTKIEAVIPCES